MQLIRALKTHFYDKKRHRLNSMAFRNSGKGVGGGISVIDFDCAKSISQCPCTHIATKYPKYSDPLIFWQFDSALLPSSHKLEVDISNGDECHYNIRNVEDDEAEDLFVANHHGSLMSCIDGLGPQSIAYKDAMGKFLAFSAN